jgi:hypothetical protein
MEGMEWKGMEWNGMINERSIRAGRGQALNRVLISIISSMQKISTELLKLLTSHIDQSAARDWRAAEIFGSGCASLRGSQSIQAALHSR